MLCYVMLCYVTANLRTNIVDFRGFDSSTILILRGGILISIGDFPEMLVGCKASREIGRILYYLPLSSPGLGGGSFTAAPQAASQPVPALFIHIVCYFVLHVEVYIYLATCLT